MHDKTNNILIVGHSHIACLSRAWNSKANKINGVEFDFLSLRDKRILSFETKVYDGACSPKELDILHNYLMPPISIADKIIFNITGSEYHYQGLIDIPELIEEHIISNIRLKVERNMVGWLNVLLPMIENHATVFILPIHPPIESEKWIIDHAGNFEEKFYKFSIRTPEERLRSYQAQINMQTAISLKYGIPIINLPDSVYTKKGYLSLSCRGTKDPTHANEEYGRRVLNHILKNILNTNSEISELKTAEVVTVKTTKKRQHPYQDRPNHTYWKQAVSEIEPRYFDPVVKPKFRLTEETKIATAGSCFASHISRKLKEYKFNFMQVEHPFEGTNLTTTDGYDFSANYGNIYTARQLLQLFERAFGYFNPIVKVWQRNGGGFCDPFRPRIEPDGYPSKQAVLKSMNSHLAAVKRMFLNLDVFVFTLGLTECWTHKIDGAVYPVAPGVVGGVYRPDTHQFINFKVNEVINDLDTFISKLKKVNAKAKILLTVSPVPLAATAEDRHVLLSTIYSKSVLRVAAQEMVQIHSNVDYFPSYEIITGPQSHGKYFGADLRSITESGVDHVMRLFIHHMMNKMDDQDKSNLNIQDELEDIEKIAEAACDEELYAK